MLKIILIGRANVGKSSLFNRLANKRIAITSDVSGTTRDTNKTQIEIFDKSAFLIDSGGLDGGSGDIKLFEAVKEKSLCEARGANIILFMVDAKMYPDEIDKKIFYSLLKLNKPSALIINKVDSKKDEARSLEFKIFGSKKTFNISVSHNSGIDELKSWLYTLLPNELKNDDEELFDDYLKEIDEQKDESFYEKKDIKVGIIGRVNVGKSSLLNALIKDNRSVVSSIAGTTIDPVNESYIYKDRIFEFVDTAGIRKRSKILGIEKFALNRTKKVLENSDIALFVLDSSEEFNELDERIAGLTKDNNLATIIILNKWDKAINKNFDEVVKEIRYKFKFLNYAPIISVSALEKKRIHKIFDLIIDVYKNYTSKIKTSKLNELIEEATKAHPIPTEKGKVVKIYYATQFDFAPPKIALVMNRPKALHFSYKRYLINFLRKNYHLEGTPVLLFPRSRNKDE